jgi:hypothetical protein
MKFAQFVFLLAFVFGVLVLPPMYFMEDYIGREAPPPITHPEFYYGFIGVTLACQLVYLMIARDPLRYRPIMPIAVLAKGSFVVSVLVLFVQGRVSTWPAMGVIADAIFAVLFAVAYVATGKKSAPASY